MIDVKKFIMMEDTRTTLMIKNIPNKFSQTLVLGLINERHNGKYDYFYMPMDLRTQCNNGYAFINFIHSIYIAEFYLEFHNMDWSTLVNDSMSLKVRN